MASKPLTDRERDRILELARGGMSRNDIARETGRAAATITKTVHAAGLTFDRTATAAATEAKKADNASRRAEQASGLLDDIARLRAQLWAPCVEKKALVVSDGAEFGAHVEVVEIKLDEPTFGDKRNIMVAAGIAIQRHVELERVDADTTGLPAVEEWLAGMLGRAVGTAIPPS